VIESAISRRRPRIRATAFLVPAAALALVPLAFAAGPVHGARYKGQVKSADVPIAVSFKVSGSGKRLSSFKIDVPNLPNKCGYGGPDQVRPAKAKIKGGKFSLKLTETTVGGTKVATAKVGGRFRSGGKEAGTIKTTSNTAKCSGSFSYSAKAA
jgi:hypothetical protein